MTPEDQLKKIAEYLELNEKKQNKYAFKHYSDVIISEIKILQRKVKRLQDSAKK